MGTSSFTTSPSRRDHHNSNEKGRETGPSPFSTGESYTSPSDALNASPMGYTLSDMADEHGFVPRHMRGGDGGIWAFIRRWFKDLFRPDRTL